MSNSNKILLFSDYLFFTKMVELPVSIKQKDMPLFVENELESSSPISIDLLKWSYLKMGGNLLIFASTADRLAQAGHTHEDINAAEFAIPEAGLLANASFKDGWNIIKMQKSIDAILVERGKWVNFISVELGGEETSKQIELLASQNGIQAYKLYSYEGYSTGALSSMSLVLKGENCPSIKASVKEGVLAKLDIREESLLKELKSTALKSKIILYMIIAIPFLLCYLAYMKVTLKKQEAELVQLQDKVQELKPLAKMLQTRMDEIESAKNFTKARLFSTLLLAKIDVLRPSEVVFTKVSTKSPTSLEITGTTTSLLIINEYVNELQMESFIESVKNENSSKSGNVKFKMSIQFKEQS